jgi:hypothetical protein
MKRDGKTGRGFMNRTTKSSQKHPEARRGIVNSLGQVEKSSALKAVFCVASEEQMSRLQISLECNGYTCTEPKPQNREHNHGLTTLRGQIFLGKEERAGVEVDIGSGEGVLRREGFRITTSDPRIKMTVKEIGGKFQKLV